MGYQLVLPVPAYYTLNGTNLEGKRVVPGRQARLPDRRGTDLNGRASEW
jgi:hypothetical protein